MGRVLELSAGSAARPGADTVPAVLSLFHRIPGRDRFRCAELRWDEDLVYQLRAALAAIPGVTGFRVSRHASSLVVSYSDTAAQDGMLETLAAIPGVEVAAAGQPPASARPRQAKPKRKPKPGPPSVDRSPPRHRPEGADTASDSGPDWHLLELAAVIQALGSDLKGLSSDEAALRLRREGPNILRKMQRRSDWRILLEQFQTAPVAMLGLSAIIALASASPLDASVIGVVVGINAAIGFLTERQAEITIANLGGAEGQRARVLRDGRVHTIAAEEVVRGDIILLDPGTALPADARLVKAHNLTVDESALTGESLPVVKKRDDLENWAALADRSNMVHLGTTVSGGDGRGVVTDTADATELGRIQALASVTDQPMTPMQTELARVSTQLAVLSSAVCGLVFVAGLLRGQPRLAMLNTAISLGVAAVPEGLPAISNSLLAIGIRRMGDNNVLARRLDAIENLGAVDVLCVDKTGTLTENRMQVMEVVGLGRGKIDNRLWKVLALCNEADLDGEKPSGSPTEQALLQAAADSGTDWQRLRLTMPRKKVRYRSDRRPWMVTLHKYPRKQGYFRAVKGRPRQVLERCSHVRRGTRRLPLSDAMRDEILQQNRELMAESYRVLGVAWKNQEDDSLKRTADLEWLGLVAMADPLRPEVEALIPRLSAAGIRTIVLTGDQLGTATAIGRRLKLNGDGDVAVLGADQLEQLSQEQWQESVRKTHVFARVSPAMKLRLVRTLQDAGHRVAMTGDGINDGPALKVADVGIAMGSSGTEVATSMSDLVLADDRLHSIVEAIAFGRGSYANLEKAIEYLLSTNFSEIEVMLTSIVTGLPTPLTPIQLLWINLITDVFPALAIGFEEPEQNVLDRPPAEIQRGMLNSRRLRELFGQSLLISAGTMASYLYGLGRYGAGRRAGSQAFMTLTLAQLLQALSSRSRSSSIYRPQGPAPNPLLQTAVLGSLGLQFATLLPGLRRILGLSRLGPLDLLVVTAGATVPFLLNEAWKLRRSTGEGEGDD
jgi:Ca2+-transporting ATPase